MVATPSTPLTVGSARSSRFSAQTIQSAPSIDLGRRVDVRRPQCGDEITDRRKLAPVLRHRLQLVDGDAALLDAVEAFVDVLAAIGLAGSSKKRSITANRPG
jgi:hypothetical protein